MKAAVSSMDSSATAVSEGNMKYKACYGIINTATGELLRKFDCRKDAENYVYLMQPEGYADFRVVIVTEG